MVNCGLLSMTTAITIQFLYQEKLVEFKKLKTVVICQSRRGPGRPKKVETTHGYYSSSNKRPDDSIESTTGNKKGRTSAVSTGTGVLTASISTSAQVQPDMILGAVDSGVALSISDARVIAHAPLQQEYFEAKYTQHIFARPRKAN